MERQQISMQSAQKGQLEQVETSQRDQFLEFSRAWDQYMADYEAAAYTSLEKLKEKHDAELVRVGDEVRAKYPVKYTFSKELMELRAMERKQFALKEYEKAEYLKRQGDKMEQEERLRAEREQQERVDKEEVKLRNKQQAQLNSLLKRIQRDRDEQLKHRMLDSQRLIQRNRNLLQDIVQKQQLESKKTLEFLKYSLGKRSPMKVKYRMADDYSNDYMQNTSKLPLIKSVQKSKEERDSHNNSGLTQMETPNKAHNHSVFLTENPLQQQDYQQRNSDNFLPRAALSFGSQRSKSTTKDFASNPFASATSQHQEFSSHSRSFQCTETMAKNFKRLQNSMQRYHSSSKHGTASKRGSNNSPLNKSEVVTDYNNTQGFKIQEVRVGSDVE